MTAECVRISLPETSYSTPTRGGDNEQIKSVSSRLLRTLSLSFIALRIACLDDCDNNNAGHSEETHGRRIVTMFVLLITEKKVIEDLHQAYVYI